MTINEAVLHLSLVHNIEITKQALRLKLLKFGLLKKKKDKYHCEVDKKKLDDLANVLNSPLILSQVAKKNKITYTKLYYHCILNGITFVKKYGRTLFKNNEDMNEAIRICKESKKINRAK